MMLVQQSPHDAYRRVDFDARVASARPDQLVALCFEQFDLALGSAIAADRRGDNARRSASLTRALAALAALQLGVDRTAAGADALLQFYDGLRRSVLGSVPMFDPATLARARRDALDVAEALGLRG